MYTFGIDIGGTTTRVSLVADGPRVVSVQRFDTPRSADALVDKLSARIASIQESRGVEAHAVGVAIAGLVDPTGACLRRSVNLPFLVEYALAERLAGRTNCRVALFTDADAATWGEYWVSTSSTRDATSRPQSGGEAKRGSFGKQLPIDQPFVHLRLGTGVACGIVAEGRLQPTGQPRTTHWSVLVVDRGPDATPCACGLRGCLETVVSGPAIVDLATRLGLPSSLGGLQAAAASRHPGVAELMDKVAGAVVVATVNLKSQISNLRSVCLGGGVIRALPCLFEQVGIRWSAEDAARDVELRLARLGDDAGVIGAAQLASR